MKKSQHPLYVSGLHLRLVTFFIRIHIFWILLIHLKGLKKAIQVANKFKEQISQYRGQNGIQKLVKVDGKYYWDMYGMGWPSRGFIRNVKRESDRVQSTSQVHVGMRNVLFAITTKCPLQCEHCFEWHNLNLPEKLSLNNLHQIVSKLQVYGVGQIHLSGGEPMMRFEDIINLLENFRHRIGFWIYTSGVGVTLERAWSLKKAGLTGMSISLDHYDETWHNRFRHYKSAYRSASEAIQFCNEVGLVTTLTICITKDFISSKNLERYVDLAKELGVSFVQFLEPKAVGHFENKLVSLSLEEKKTLGDFYLQTIRDKKFQNHPDIMYHEFYKESLGCRGAGNGTFYIDPLGGVHACPFCRQSVGNLITDRVEDCVNNLWTKGCGSIQMPRNNQPSLVANSETVGLT